MPTMKQITNKEYKEWQKYKAEKAKGHVLLPDTVRFICEANGYDAEKIGQHFLFCAKKTGQETDVSVCLLSGCYFFEPLALRAGDTLSYPRRIVKHGFPAAGHQDLRR